MNLNALFVPASRPESCGINLGFPNILGIKYVRPGGQAGDDVNGNGVINPGDTVEWTVVYYNSGSLSSTNFQITDSILGNKTFVGAAGSQTVLVSGAGTTASANASYNGTAPNNLLLDTGAVLGVNGAIAVKVRTQISIAACSPSCGSVTNQATADGDGNGDPVFTDNVDFSTNFGSIPQVASFIPPANSVLQDQMPSVDPTVVLLALPTAADVYIEGRVVGTNGRGLAGITVSLMDGTTGLRKTATSNSFGVFRIEDLEIGNFYTLTAINRKYTFNQLSFTLDDNLSGLTLVGTPGTQR
jgi:uncharacterized repeat protein (TIGR01451 family)